MNKWTSKRLQCVVGTYLVKRQQRRNKLRKMGRRHSWMAPNQFFGLDFSFVLYFAKSMNFKQTYQTFLNLIIKTLMYGQKNVTKKLGHPTS